MTTPREEQPATAAATPTVSTAPPRTRWRFSNVPAHVGPARTSTVILGVLFLVLFGLHSYLQSASDTGYTTVTTDTGQRIRVKSSAISSLPPPATPAPPATTTPPRSSVPATGTTPGRTSAPGAPATATTGTSAPAAPRSTTAAPTRTTTDSTAPVFPTTTGTPTS